MNISRHRRILGVGPLGFAGSSILFALLWLLESNFIHGQILSHSRPLKIAGLVFVAIWFCWHVWSLRAIRFWRDRHALCTTGPYRFVRHPIYAGGIFLAGYGVALMFNAWIMLAAPLLSYPFWSFLARKEERMTATVFGETYKQYAKRTGGFLPKLFK